MIHAIFHHPGVMHKETSVGGVGQALILREALERLGSEGIGPGGAVNEDTFFSRFIVFFGGNPICRMNAPLRGSRVLLIVAANKLARTMEPLRSRPSSSPSCQCGDSKIVYGIPTKVVRGEVETRYFCRACFRRFLEDRVLDNIAHDIAGRESIDIDLGLSGERDSTLALHFLALFRRRIGARYRIRLFFNSPGLGEYDEQRFLAASAAATKYLDKEDTFVANSFDLDLHSVVRPDPQRVSADFCKLCSRVESFRNYGTYFNQEHVGSSGGGTIEDQLVQLLLLSSRRIDRQAQSSSRMPVAESLQRLSLYHNVSEEWLAVYAAIEGVDYCVMDCPIAESVLAYRCRRQLLGDFKRLRPDYHTDFSPKPLCASWTVFGQVSPVRRVWSPSRAVYCPDCRTTHWHDNGVPADYPQDDLLAEAEIRISEALCQDYSRWRAGFVRTLEQTNLQDIDVDLRLRHGVQLTRRKCIWIAHNVENDELRLLRLQESMESEVLERLRERDSISLLTLRNELSLSAIEALTIVRKLVTDRIVKVEVPGSEVAPKASTRRTLVTNRPGLLMRTDFAALVGIDSIDVRSSSIHEIAWESMSSDDWLLLFVRSASECLDALSRRGRPKGTRQTCRMGVIHCGPILTAYFGCSSCLEQLLESHWPDSALTFRHPVPTDRLIRCIDNAFFEYTQIDRGDVRGSDNHVYLYGLIDTNRRKEIYPCRCWVPGPTSGSVPCAAGAPEQDSERKIRVGARSG